MCACEIASYLAAMKATSWHWHLDVTSHARISQIVLYFLFFSAPRSCGCGDGSHSLIFLFFADWSGKWRGPLLLQPIQFKVKWCVLSEMSFCTLLLYWAVIYFFFVPVNLNKFRRSPLTSPKSNSGGGGDSESGSDIVRSQSAQMIKSFRLFLSHVCSEHGRITFKGYSFDLIPS